MHTTGHRTCGFPNIPRRRCCAVAGTSGRRRVVRSLHHRKGLGAAAEGRCGDRQQGQSCAADIEPTLLDLVDIGERNAYRRRRSRRITARGADQRILRYAYVVENDCAEVLPSDPHRAAVVRPRWAGPFPRGAPGGEDYADRSVRRLPRWVRVWTIASLISRIATRPALR